MSIMLIFLADITYHPLSGPALTRRPPGAWIPPTAAPVDAHFVTHATIIYRAPPACTAVQPRAWRAPPACVGVQRPPRGPR